MEYDQLSGCCGAHVISDFEDFEEYEYGECMSRKERRAAAKAELQSRISYCGNGKLVMLTLIDQQLRDGWLSIVQELGFRRIARWVNSNHGNTCNLYVLENNCSKPPKYKGKEK